jgi:uncharacterized protein (TIGR02246 family)
MKVKTSSLQYLFSFGAAIAISILSAELAVANSSVETTAPEAAPEATAEAAPEASSAMVVYQSQQTLPEATAVEDLGQTWGTALASRDPQQITALYSPEAVLLATFVDELDTEPEILEYFKGLTQREGLNVQFEEQNIRVLDENTLSNSGLYTFSFVENGETVYVPARYTFLYEKQDDQWLIVEHHSSIRPETTN